MAWRICEILCLARHAVVPFVCPRQAHAIHAAYKRAVANARAAEDGAACADVSIIILTLRRDAGGGGEYATTAANAAVKSDDSADVSALILPLRRDAGGGSEHATTAANAAGKSGDAYASLSTLILALRRDEGGTTASAAAKRDRVQTVHAG